MSDHNQQNEANKYKEIIKIVEKAEKEADKFIERNKRIDASSHADYS